ncbi:MAG: hypothetical protein HUJ51_03995, partial [Eggerthellaceae bacterium]|nr:hypothetical protein [Eggerthellaceae bacterium]
QTNKDDTTNEDGTTQQNELIDADDYAAMIDDGFRDAEENLMEALNETTIGSILRHIQIAS